MCARLRRTGISGCLKQVGASGARASWAGRRRVWNAWHSAGHTQGRAGQALLEWQLIFAGLSLHAGPGMQTGLQRQRGRATCAQRKDVRGVTATGRALTHTHTHLHTC